LPPPCLPPAGEARRPRLTDGPSPRRCCHWFKAQSVCEEREMIFVKPAFALGAPARSTLLLCGAGTATRVLPRRFGERAARRRWRKEERRFVTRLVAKGKTKGRLQWPVGTKRTEKHGQISRAVASATSRLSCSSARRKIRGWPWEVDAAPPWGRRRRAQSKPPEAKAGKKTHAHVVKTRAAGDA
jgi:hypothetical protein